MCFYAGGQDYTFQRAIETQIWYTATSVPRLPLAILLKVQTDAPKTTNIPSTKTKTPLTSRAQ